MGIVITLFINNQAERNEVVDNFDGVDVNVSYNKEAKVYDHWIRKSSGKCTSF